MTPMPARISRLLPLVILATALPVAAGATVPTVSTKGVHGTSSRAPATGARATKSVAKIPAPAASAGPRLFLSWNAPFGEPRATAAIAAPCGEAATDTLYMSFDPGKDAPAFVGATAVLYFEAAPGSELPERWAHGTVAAPPVRVTFEADPDRGFVTPWSSQAAGGPYYDVLDGRGRLRLIYAIAANSGPGVKAGKLYGYARVLVPRSPAGADGCAAPLCVEWESASLAFGPKDEGNTDQGERWVTMNSPDGAACVRSRSPFGAAPWQPHTTR